MSDAAVSDGGNSDASAVVDAMAATLAGGGDERLAYRGVFQRLFVRPEIGAIVGAFAIWAFFWSVSREFGTAGGMSSILDVSATLGIMAVAVSLLMIGGEFDLSSGAATGTFAIVTILLVKDVGDLGGAGLSLWAAIPLSLVFALALGWINGTVTERTGLPSFIVTLATFFILRGFKLGFSKLMIDNLTVGRISEAEGRGHEFWEPVFATVWIRNEHQLDFRAGLYGLFVLLALVLISNVGARLTGVSKILPNLLAAAFASSALFTILVEDTTGWTRARDIVLGTIVLAAIFIGLASLSKPSRTGGLLVVVGAIAAVLRFTDFGAEFGWLQHDVRDSFYTVGIIGGLSLLAFAVAELNFSRSDTLRPAGLLIFALGVAGVIAGILYMHNSDGQSANTVAVAILGISGLAAFGGFCMWRYEGQAAGALRIDRSVSLLLGGGLLACAVGVVSAVALGAESQESVLDLVGVLRWPFVLAAAAYAAFRTFEKSKGDSNTTSQTAVNVGAVACAAAFSVYAFMFMTTEQGLRAILFGVAVLAGLALLAMAANKAGRTSPLSRGTVLTVFALVLVALAFFIQSQSDSVKFRSELFSVLLAAALVVFAWGVCSTLFVQRRVQEVAADGLGTQIAKIGSGAVAVGMISKLLFTTEAELAAGIPRAGFRISILWFFGVSLFATWLLGRTKFGSWIFAVGGNKQAARQVGVPAARTKTQLFMLVSVAAWLVGLLLAFRLDTVQSVAGNGLEFEYIIAAVVGGTLLTGGYGSAFGAAIGAVIVAMAKQGIPSARWNSDWRFAFLGLILLTAVIANNFIKTKAEESR